MKTGIELIVDERNRQVSDEGWTASHDDDHDDCEMLAAAVLYAASTFPDKRATEVARAIPFPWDGGSDKREKHDRKRRLVIAGALIAAEIDRLSRLEATDGCQ